MASMKAFQQNLAIWSTRVSYLCVHDFLFTAACSDNFSSMPPTIEKLYLQNTDLTGVMPDEVCALRDRGSATALEVLFVYHVTLSVTWIVVAHSAFNLILCYFM